MPDVAGGTELLNHVSSCVAVQTRSDTVLISLDMSYIALLYLCPKGNWFRRLYCDEEVSCLVPEGRSGGGLRAFIPFGDCCLRYLAWAFCVP